MSRVNFFDAIRSMFSSGALLPVQVNVIEDILDQGRDLPREHLAYILATAFGEAKFVPKSENMYYSAQRIKIVWPNRPEAVEFARNPQGLANCVYNGRLGNRRGSNDGWAYRGGGIDQLTGAVNYAKIGIEAAPEQILQPAVAVKSIMHGMTTGRYTGKKLSDYDTPKGFNFKSARAIVNGDVRLNGEKYAGYARKFLAALELLDDAPAPVDHVPVKKAAPTAQPWYAAVIAAIMSLFGGAKHETR